MEENKTPLPKIEITCTEITCPENAGPVGGLIFNGKEYPSRFVLGYRYTHTREGATLEFLSSCSECGKDFYSLQHGLGQYCPDCIAIHSEQPDDKEPKTATRKAKGDEESTDYSQNLRFFNPEKQEILDISIVDLSHPKGEAIAKALEDWGSEQTSYNKAEEIPK